jgi:hypothetical protein
LASVTVSTLLGATADALIVSEGPNGVANACWELALSPPAFTPVTT